MIKLARYLRTRTFANRVGLCSFGCKRWFGEGSGNESLEESDPDIYSILRREKQRQIRSLELIASENFTSKAVQSALGSCASNKVAEGYPGARYYGGAEHVDEIESLCHQRALAAFRLDPDKWGVNVQPLAGSPANFSAYTGLLNPHDRIMGLNLPDGGHLTQGFMTADKRISATSVYFESLPYKLNPSTGLIDYDRLEEMAVLFRPKLIIAGTSTYPRLLDYPRFRKIADKYKAILLADMAHISGLVAADVVPSPFDYADVVISSTYKTLRGPKHGIIFFKKGVKSISSKTGKEILYDYEKRINQAVFPGTHGAPHQHSITALAVALKQAASSEFKKYQEQVLLNSQTMAKYLQEKGYTLVSGGTETHLILVDLRPFSLDGAAVEFVCEKCSISVNKNSVPGDKSALKPGGFRLGTPALTSRGLNEADFLQVMEYFDSVVQVARTAVNITDSLNMKDLNEVVQNNEEVAMKIRGLKENVEAFCIKFPMPGNSDY